MKIACLIVMMALVQPLSAGELEIEERVFQQALESLPRHMRSVRVSALERLHDDQYAVSDLTIGNAPEHLRRFATDWHGSAIADEIIASYEERRQSPRRIGLTNVKEVPVYPLERFRTDALNYDWARLNATYPEVRAIVRISRPATDSLGTYAVVRYEVISPGGPAWASFIEFQKQFDGSWKWTHGNFGSIWK